SCLFVSIRGSSVTLRRVFPSSMKRNMRKLLTFVAALVAVAPILLAQKDAPAIKPYLLTPKTTYDGQPTLCQTSDGTTWSGWLAYSHPAGDAVMVTHKENGTWAASEQVNTTRAQIVRPTLVAVGKTVWVFWTETGNNLARVLYSKRADGKWSSPEVLTPANAA